MKQVTKLHKEFDRLQSIYGDPELNSIYGAGETNNPNIMFIFMNPTAKNISSNPSWAGLRAPWIGTKQVWDIFSNVGLLDEMSFDTIKNSKAQDWNVEFANEIYMSIEKNSVYITNLAKCTQIDARPLNNNVFKEYLELMYEEIEIVKPKIIISFGNQVSSILLNKQISVSNYIENQKKELKLKSLFDVYPTYYPVGQGRRNMPIAIERIKFILKTVT